MPIALANRSPASETVHDPRDALREVRLANVETERTSQPLQDGAETVAQLEQPGLVAVQIVRIDPLRDVARQQVVDLLNARIDLGGRLETEFGPEKRVVQVAGDQLLAFGPFLVLQRVHHLHRHPRGEKTRLRHQAQRGVAVAYAAMDERFDVFSGSEAIAVDADDDTVLAKGSLELFGHSAIRVTVGDEHGAGTRFRTRAL